MGRKNLEVHPAVQAILEKSPAQRLDGYSIYQAEFPPPVFLFDNLLANGLTILAGRPKSGKSWLTLQMAMAAAMQGLFLGRFGIDRVVKVLYCGLEEGPRRTHNRLRKLLPKPDIQLANITFRYELKSLASGAMGQLDELLTAGRFELVIIDTFLKVAHAHGNRDILRSEYAEIAQLQELAHKHDIAIVLVAHTRKMGAENGLDMVAGSTGITAACDAVWTLRKQVSGDSILEITGREMEEQTLGLRFATADDFGWHLIGEGPEVGLSAQRQEILELLKEEQPLSPAGIARSLRKNAVTVRRLLQKLLADGLVRKEDNGNYRLVEP